MQVVIEAMMAAFQTVTEATCPIERNFAAVDAPSASTGSS